MAYGDQAPMHIRLHVERDDNVQNMWARLFTESLGIPSDHNVESVLCDIISKLVNILTRRWVADITKADQSVHKKRAHRIEVSLTETKNKQKRTGHELLVTGCTPLKKLPKRDIELNCEAYYGKLTDRNDELLSHIKKHMQYWVTSRKLA